MKRLALFLLAASLQAATYYVANPGNNANAGTSVGAPWADLQYAVNHAACGDIINIVANGAYVPGDATLPYFAGCSLVTTVQSSALAQFWPPGYRTNTVNDAAIYGKLRFTSNGIQTTTELHGSQVSYYGACGVSSITSSVFTLTGANCAAWLPNLANGSQIEFEQAVIANQSATLSDFPTPLTFMQHYWIVNCTGSCGAAGSTFQVAATSGGSPITITSCNGVCVSVLTLSEPLQFTSGSATITSPDAFTGLANGSPVTVSATGVMKFGTVPTPFQKDTIYYIVNLSGRTFGLAATLGGSAIVATSIGTGPSMLAGINVPHHWAFRGLETVNVPGNSVLTHYNFGTGSETSVLGMVHHVEVDRCYMHDNPADVTGPEQGIVDNAAFGYYHDNYCAGMRNSEAKCIAGWGSPGRTAIINNFLEATTENTMYGGNSNAAGIANADKLFQGNYYYKPPIWKVATNTGAASGACMYDNLDPQHTGGEWYTDSNTAQVYQCGSNGLWATTGAAMPTAASLVVKNTAEHKSGRNFTYLGNIMNGSWTQSTQKGQAFTWHQSADSGPGMANDHVTAMHNKVFNVLRFVTQGSFNNSTTAYSNLNPPSNFTVVNNLGIMNSMSCGVLFTTGSNSCSTQLAADSFDGYPDTGHFWNHNTIVPPNTQPSYAVYAFFASTDVGCVATNGPLDYYTYKNSIFAYDFQGDCTNGGGTFSTYFTHAFFDKNALVYHNGAINYSSPGATNTFSNFDTSSATNAAVGYVNLAAGDYHLASTSNYSAQNLTPLLISDDLTDLGADIDRVNMETSGAAAGTPPWDAKAGLSILAGSTKLVFRYTAPSSLACTAKIFTPPIAGSLGRLPANLVATVLDSASGSIQDVSRRELYISGLTASTAYNWSLSCANGAVLLVNKELLYTRAAGSAVNWPVGTPGGGTVTYCTDAAMSAGCVTTGSGTAQLIPVPSNTPIYWRTTADTSLPSILLAP